MTHAADAAQTLALKALTWLVGNDEILPVFLGASGSSTDELRVRAGDPDFLGAVLDFLMMDDAWIVAFCDSAGIGYDQPMQARLALPGGEQMNWT
jgi:uncharacterized protein DUF3572